MRLGVSMWSYFYAWKAGRITIQSFIEHAAVSGAEGVELLDFFYQGDVPAGRELAKAGLDATGLPVAIFSVSNNFAKLEPAERSAQVDRIKFGVDEANHYGAKVVRVFAGDVAEGITFDQARGWIIDGLRSAAEYAADQGVKLALENHGTLAGKSAQVRGIIDEVGIASLGANPDTGNFLLVGQDSAEAIADLADVANMVHFKDFRRALPDYEGFAYAALDGTRYVGTSLGEGDVDLAKCIGHLRDAGHAGWLSLEFEGEEDPLTAVPRSLESARRFL